MEREKSILMVVACSSIMLLKAKQKRKRNREIWVKEWFKNSSNKISGSAIFLKESPQKNSLKDTVTFYIIISRIIFFLTVILYDMISKTFRNPE